MTPRMKLPRRTLLRGLLGGTAAVTVGLPTFEQMLNGNGTAHADGSALPKRFGVFFWGNGKPWTHDGRPDLWTPSSVGKDWAMTELLAPLEAYRDRFNVITGLDPKTQWEPTPDGQSDGHMRGAACALTSDRCSPVGFDHPTHTFAFERATLDQVIATHPQFYGANPTQFRSLELGVSQIRFHDYGHWNAISHSGPNMLNLPILETSQVYAKLFGLPPDEHELAARSSILDAVSDDMRALRGRLGARDRERLDAHMTHLEEINRRLTSGQAICARPGAPANYPVPTPSGQLHAKMATMVDLLAFALQCDLTRVFTLMFTSPATNEVIAEAGATSSLHQHCHDGAWEIVRQATRFQMQAFNLLLDRFANAADFTGKLLDNTVILGTSEYGEGNLHGVGEFPVILAGNAGGMQTGSHVRDVNGNLSKAHVTILRTLGIDTPSYGFHGAETDKDFLADFGG